MKISQYGKTRSLEIIDWFKSMGYLEIRENIESKDVWIMFKNRNRANSLGWRSMYYHFTLFF